MSIFAVAALPFFGTVAGAGAMKGLGLADEAIEDMAGVMCLVFGWFGLYVLAAAI